jgi:hypothetical protein
MMATGFILAALTINLSMLNCKVNIIIAICTTAFLSGCIEAKYDLDIRTTLNKNAKSFFNQLPGINGKPYNKQAIKVNATTLEVYKASFSETTIEKDNLLEITELNSNSDHPIVSYWNTDGFTQYLYLLKYDFTCNASGDDLTYTAVVFLSFRYMPIAAAPFTKCTGPGPLYWGVLNDDHISFDSVLTIKNVKTGPYLTANKANRKNHFNLLFMPVVFSDQAETNGDSINIKKIVRTDHNKVGGKKPLVFNIREIFHDSLAMRFDYINTIKLNP